MNQKLNANRSIGWPTLAVAVATFLVLAVSGCAPQADVAAVEVIDMAAEEAAVKQMIQDWLVATNESGQAGADGYASFFTEDGVVLPPNAERQDGRDAISAWVLQFHEIEGFSISWEANRIEISASADLAYAIGTYEYSVNDADGNPVEDRGKFLDALRKQADGSWQASSGMFNSDLPLTAPVD